MMLDRVPWPDWFFIIVTGWLGILVAIAMMAVALILDTWALSLVLNARLIAREERRSILASLDYWLGSWYFADSLIYWLLGFAVLIDDDPLDLWAVLLLLLVTIPGLVAFAFWWLARRPVKERSLT